MCVSLWEDRGFVLEKVEGKKFTISQKVFLEWVNGLKGHSKMIFSLPCWWKARWGVADNKTLPEFYSKTVLQRSSQQEKQMGTCFQITFQKYFAIYKNSLEFPLAWRREDNDGIQMFIELILYRELEFFFPHRLTLFLVFLNYNVLLHLK